MTIEASNNKGFLAVSSRKGGPTIRMAFGWFFISARTIQNNLCDGPGYHSCERSAQDPGPNYLQEGFQKNLDPQAPEISHLS